MGPRPDPLPAPLWTPPKFFCPLNARVAWSRTGSGQGRVPVSSGCGPRNASCLPTYPPTAFNAVGVSIFKWGAPPLPYTHEGRAPNPIHEVQECPPLAPAPLFRCIWPQHRSPVFTFAHRLPQRRRLPHSAWSSAPPRQPPPARSPSPSPPPRRPLLLPPRSRNRSRRPLSPSLPPKPHPSQRPRPRPVHPQKHQPRQVHPQRPRPRQVHLRRPRPRQVRSPRLRQSRRPSPSRVPHRPRLLTVKGPARSRPPCLRGRFRPNVCVPSPPPLRRVPRGIPHHPTAWPTHRGTVHLGTGKTWHLNTKVHQILPRYFKVRSHFPRCH